MSLSRRGFLKGLLGLVAGIAGSRIIGTPPPVVAAPGPPAHAHEFVGEIGVIERFRFIESPPSRPWGRSVALQASASQARLNKYKGEILKVSTTPLVEGTTPTREIIRVERFDTYIDPYQDPYGYWAMYGLVADPLTGQMVKIADR